MARQNYIHSVCSWNKSILLASHYLLLFTSRNICRRCSELHVRIHQVTENLFLKKEKSKKHQTNKKTQQQQQQTTNKKPNPKAGSGKLGRGRRRAGILSVHRASGWYELWKHVAGSLQEQAHPSNTRSARANVGASWLSPQQNVWVPQPVKNQELSL